MKRVLVIALMMAACREPQPPVQPAVVIATPKSSAAERVVEEPPHYRETPDAPFRNGPPEIADAAPFVMPVVHTFQLKNKARVWLLERHTPKMVRVRLAFGLEDAPPFPVGATTLVADCLRRGAPSKSERAISERFDDDFASYDFDVRANHVEVSFTAAAAHFGDALALFSELVRAPTLAEPELERERRWHAEQREQETQAPAPLAHRILPMALFGTKDPLDVYPMQRASDFRALSRADVKSTYDELFDPARATFVVVGDTTDAALRESLEKNFSHWTSQSKIPHKPRPPLVAASATPRIVFVDRPASTQALVMFGAMGPPRSSRDAAAMMVNASLLFDPTSSFARIVRDERHTIAAMTSMFDFFPSASLLTWSAELLPEKMAETLRVLDAEIARLRDADVDAQSLADARTHLATSEQSWAGTMMSASGTLALYASARLTVGDLAALPERLRAVEAQDVRRVARQMFDPAHTKILVVGNWSDLRAELLALGPVEIRDVNGAVLRIEKP